MIAEIIPEAYDIYGKHTFYPRKKRFKFFAPNSPTGRHITQPLTVECKTLEDIREFLNNCRHVSDEEQFGVDDYWMPPDEFEIKRQGDCDDFALWVWRQLIAMGKKEPRFVAGRAGPYGDGHAWVTFLEGDRAFLVEPMAHRWGSWMPRLKTVNYVPGISVSWDGKKFAYFEHEKRTFEPPLRLLVPLVAEWLLYWLKTRPYFSYLLVRYLIRRLRRGFTLRSR
jgi:hypothetical protein